MKKGVVWVAAVLYIAVGITAITLILSAAIPVINKLKDRNTFSQTKEILFVIDENVRNVVQEGTASQRELNPLTITAGNFEINETTITWKMKTEALIVEPSRLPNRIIKREGNLEIWQEDTNIRDEYTISIKLNYDKIKLYINPGSANMPLQGTYTMLIRNSGETDSGRVIVNLTIS